MSRFAGMHGPYQPRLDDNLVNTATLFDAGKGVLVTGH